MYKITEIELSEKGKKFIFDKLIELFTVNPQLIAESTNGVEVNFPLDETVEVYATLDLNVEYDEFDGNHQNKAISVYPTLKISLMSKGEEVKGTERWNIEDMICSYDWKKFF